VRFWYFRGELRPHPNTFFFPLGANLRPSIAFPKGTHQNCTLLAPFRLITESPLSPYASSKDIFPLVPYIRILNFPSPPFFLTKGHPPLFLELSLGYRAFSLHVWTLPMFLEDFFFPLVFSLPFREGSTFPTLRYRLYSRGGVHPSHMSHPFCLLDLLGSMGLFLIRGHFVFSP